ncbi:MAG: LamG domain-containing protein [Thaumarchaeota archaeon]|nr:LamG domain-containing protein [Nitrososphaerota archaeon]
MSQEASALSSLVGNWLFNEATGTIAHDTSGNHHDGTINGATHLPAIDCRVFRCLGFDGVDDSVSVGSLGISSDTQPFSIAAWVKPDVKTATNNTSAFIIVANGGTKCCLNTGDFFANLRIGEGSTFGNVVAEIGSTQTYSAEKITANGKLTAGHWSHVVLTYDGSRTFGGIKIYIDGVLQPTKNLGPGFSGTPNPRDDWIIGAERYGSDNNDFFGGSIDTVKIYSCALNKIEVKQVFYGFNIVQC